MIDQNVEIKSKTSQEFIERLIDMIGPDKERLEKQAKYIVKQIMFASIAKLVTGKDGQVVCTPEIIDGHLEGIDSEITGEAVETMADMEAEEIVKAVVPHILFVCSITKKPDFGSFLADLLKEAEANEENEDDDSEENSSAA